MDKKIKIYTDGSSLGNPGNSGWGAIFFVNDKIFEMGGWKKEATNNQMELMAILKSFEKLVSKNISNYQIDILSDSKYCIDGTTKWILGWKKNNWKNSQKQPVKNKELWEKIDSLKLKLEEQNKITFYHIKAHSGEKYNERVDDIARISAEEQSELTLFSGKKEDYL